MRMRAHLTEMITCYATRGLKRFVWIVIVESRAHSARTNWLCDCDSKLILTDYNQFIIMPRFQVIRYDGIYTSSYNIINNLLTHKPAEAASSIDWAKALEGGS